MFSFPPYKSVRDITWDEGQSFFFRDYRKKAVHSGVSIWGISHYLYRVRVIKLPKHLRKQIINFCKCQSFDVVLLKGSLSDHIIHKKQLKVLRKKHYKQVEIKWDKIK